MSNVPAELRYAKSHEWSRAEPDGTVTVGITDFAQQALGDLVYVEVPAVGRVVKAGEACAVVESVKTASDVYAPISGRISAANSELADRAERVNNSPYQDGWLFVIAPDQIADLDALHDAAAYQALIDA